MAAALTLTDTTNATATRTPRRANPQTSRIQQLAEDWDALDGIQKGTWNALSQRTADPLQPQAAPSRDTAYTAFIAANSALLSSGQAILATAPDAHLIPPALPALHMDSDFGGGTLTLSLIAATPYLGHRVLLYAARPQLAGRPLYPSTAFTFIGSLPQIDNENILDLYQAKFRVPSAGYQITLKVCPVSATGYRRAPVTVSTIVAPISSAPLKLK